MMLYFTFLIMALWPYIFYLFSILILDTSLSLLELLFWRFQFYILDFSGKVQDIILYMVFKLIINPVL